VTLETGTGSLADSLPLPLTAVSRQEPDEVQIQVVFPQGLHQNALETVNLRVPFRIRIRPTGVSPGSQSDVTTVEPLTVPDLTYSSGATVWTAGFDRTKSVLFAANVTFAASPDGIIWEQGGSFAGAYLGVTAGELVFRAGDGASGGTTQTAMIRRDVSDVAGTSVLLVAQVIMPGTVRLTALSDGQVIFTEVATSSTGDFPFGVWTGKNDGAIGRAESLVAGGESTANFNGTIAGARFYFGDFPFPIAGPFPWTDLPELHFRAASIKQMRSTITLRWTDDPDNLAPDAAPGEGYAEARISTPAQVEAPPAPGWSASSYFDGGSGADFMDSSNLGSTAVRRIAMTRYGVLVLLDEAVFPRGRYEIEIRRGQVFDEADYDEAAYTLGGDVYDLFGSYGTPARVFFSRDSISDAAYVQRIISVWNDTPLPTDDFAVVAIRARNRQINRLSVLSGGYVRDLTTNEWITTSNPAPHLYDIWQGRLNADPVPTEIIDLDALLEWEAHCDAEGYECNALMEGQTVADAERIVASCGYAKPITSDRWSIVMDRDRSAEAPVQIFTPRNSSNFRMSKGFADVPDGFLVTFRDEAREYDSNQIVHPPEAADSDFIEQITYEGLVREDEARQRAQFDLDQVKLRSTFYSIDVPTESIVCRRGSLVGVSNDVLSGEAGFARVVGYKVDGASDVTEIHLDAEVRVTNEGDVKAAVDMHAVVDMHALGSPTKAHIRQKNGSIVTRTVTGATGDRSVIVLDAPVPSSQIGRDTLVATGRSRPDFNRMIVFAIRPRPQLMATLTLVDEAPELWNPA